jgi:glycosyltransferase involved in cell wall biosynthesis
VARSEAFGLVQVEAMACGTPVINAAIPRSGVPWVSPDGVTGLTVPVDDPSALAAAANRLLDEPGLRDRLGAAGRERAVREFDHRVMARRSLAIYGRVLGRPAPGSDDPEAGDDAEADPALMAPSGSAVPPA